MVFLPNKNVIFVAGLGGIGLDTSREIVKAGPKVSSGPGSILNPQSLHYLQSRF